VSQSEEVPERDHRRLGPKLELFGWSEHSPGIAYWLPRGVVVRNQLISMLREQYAQRGYEEVIGPQVLDAELWEKSGHLAAYRDSMYFLESESRELALKPMNCPGQALMFASRPRSFRELPFRWAEFSPIHRYEASGALCGLKRARGFVVDDAHVFCREDQIHEEVLRAIDFVKSVYGLFGFEFRVDLGLRPARSVGSDAIWQRAEADLRAALKEAHVPSREAPGDGAFYGPKLDFRIVDALGREWQCGSVQLDFNMPERFGLSYRGSDNREHRPVMVHRAVLGSLERFIAILLEHGDGALPLWLSPEQVRVLPVSSAHDAYAEAVLARLRKAGVRASLVRDDRVGKRVRDAMEARVPYVAVVGDREQAAGAVSVRARGVEEVVALDSFLARVHDEAARRA
jgi:threonyl-tRNA synthetase